MELKVIHKLPTNLRNGAIERAVKAFVADSHTEETNADPIGLFNQTLECIAQACLFNQDGKQFWIAEHEGEVFAYALTHVSKDVDNRLCYWMTQAWVHPKVRGHRIVKIWRDQLVAEGKRLLCKHIVIPSSRSTKAYLRFLGQGWHKYVTLLKVDL